MSDEKSNDKPHAKPRAPGRAATAPGSAKRTMVGLPISDPRAQYQANQESGGGHDKRPGHGGYRPAEPDAEPLKPRLTVDDGYVADKLYMDPPSESFGRAPTHVAISAPPPAAQQVAQVPAREPSPEPPRGPNLAASALRAAQGGGTPERSGGPNFASAALHAAQQTIHENLSQRAPAPRTSFANPAAPDAGRADVRRMADRGGPATSAANAGHAGNQRPGSSNQANPNLRLKLDMATDEEHYRGVPKSRLPRMLLWLLIIGGAAGGAYWATTEGGIEVVRARVEALIHGRGAAAPQVPGSPPADQSAAQPNEAVPPAAAAQQTRETQQTPAGATPQPSAAEANPPAQAPGQAAQAARAPQASKEQDERAARELADPEPPSEAAAAQAPAKPTEKPTEKPKPTPPAAAAKPSKPSPPAHRPVRNPVISVKPIGSAAPPPNAPPEPAGTPYVPSVPIDPPAPDEPR